MAKDEIKENTKRKYTTQMGTFSTTNFTFEDIYIDI